MKKYELIVIWETGEKNIDIFETYGAAVKAEKNMIMAFGRQIVWTGINEKWL